MEVAYDSINKLMYVDKSNYNIQVLSMFAKKVTSVVQNVNNRWSLIVSSLKS